jgi:hypothetical protein
VGEGYEHHFVTRKYEFWRKVLHKVFGFFCDVKTRICETLALRKDFRMIGTTLRQRQSKLFANQQSTEFS